MAGGIPRAVITPLGTMTSVGIVNKTPILVRQEPVWAKTPSDCDRPLS